IAEEPELDDLLNVARVQDRHHRVDERELALMRQRRRLARMVVAGRDEHAAVPRRPRRIAVLERVAGAIDARSLAVPEREHAVVARAGEEPRLLGAPDRRRGEVLVQARLEADTGRLEITLRAPELPVEAAERRAAVSRYVTCRRQSGAPIEVALREQQAHERLQSGDVQRAALAPVAFVEILDSAHAFGRPPRHPAGPATTKCRDYRRAGGRMHSKAYAPTDVRSVLRYAPAGSNFDERQGFRCDRARSRRRRDRRRTGPARHLVAAAARRALGRRRGERQRQIDAARARCRHALAGTGTRPAHVRLR